MITLDVEHLSIPETEYSSVVTINSNEFSKICRELFSLSETLTITTQVGQVHFSVESEAGSGRIKLGQNDVGGDANERTLIEVNAGVE